MDEMITSENLKGKRLDKERYRWKQVKENPLTLSFKKNLVLWN
jgi:hypothetical protein